VLTKFVFLLIFLSVHRWFFHHRIWLWSFAHLFAFNIGG